jgi:signal transduction histidine kinase
MISNFFLITLMDKKRPLSLNARSLAMWLVASFGAFVLVGSIALMAFFQYLTKVEEEVALESLGRTNALFLDQSSLPQSKHMAEQLGRVMGADVEFRDVSDASEHNPADGIARRGESLLEVGFKLKNAHEVWFSRKAKQPGIVPFWKRLDAQLALGGFWALSLLFSVWIGRKVTRPLAKLAAVIPEIGGDQPLSGLPSSGPQEIVSLANALGKAHGSLVEEREKRRHAERLALLGRMATSLAHEVRNPVAAIRLHAQLLERVCGTDEKMSVALIISEAERIEFLVNQWLRYAKPEPVKMVPVDLEELAADACYSLSLQAKHAEVVIHQEIDPSWREHQVKGDRERLRQVLCNLLLNAIQSMPNGGEIKLRVSPGLLEVEDQGVGFSSEGLERFGEPFHSEREGGMGLGVAVSTEIIESHGGKISAENLPQKGARVRIVWPKPPNER